MREEEEGRQEKKGGREGGEGRGGREGGERHEHKEDGEGKHDSHSHFADKETEAQKQKSPVQGHIVRNQQRQA